MLVRRRLSLWASTKLTKEKKGVWVIRMQIESIRLKDVRNSGIQPQEPMAKKVITEDSIPELRPKQVLQNQAKKITSTDTVGGRVDIYG